MYRDAGISGAKGRDKRPGFDAMHKDAARRRFDVVMAWSVDRLGRSLQDLIAFMQELRSLKIDLFLHQQGLDTTTPAGKMMFQVLGSFAEYERDMIRARVNAGIARAKAAGKHCGRPPLAPELAERNRQAMAVPRQARHPGDCQAVRRVSDDGPERGQLGEAVHRRGAGQNGPPGGTFPQQDEGGGLQEPSPHTNTP